MTKKKSRLEIRITKSEVHGDFGILVYWRARYDNKILKGDTFFSIEELKDFDDKEMWKKIYDTYLNYRKVLEYKKKIKKLKRQAFTSVNVLSENLR